MPTPGFKGWAHRLSHNALKFGFDAAHGGVFSAGPFGRRASDRRKVWWVQAESLIAFLEMYRLTGHPAYYGAFKRTLDFVQAHHVVPEGGWWATLTADGAPLVGTRAKPNTDE